MGIRMSSLPQGQQWVQVRLPRPVYLSYVAPNTRAVAKMLGGQVRMYPDFFWSPPGSRILLLQVVDPLSKLATTTFPFIILHPNSSMSIISFKIQENGTYKELVLAWLKWFNTHDRKDDF